MSFNISTINDELTSFSGGGGGIVLNDFFIGGYGMNSNINNTPVIDNTPIGYENFDINLAYGGIWMGYSFLDKKVIHPFVSLKTGLGNVRVYELNDDNPFIRENVFVVTPEIGVEVNLTKWIKLVGSVNYRSLSGMDDTNFMTSSDFNGLGGGLTLRYGFFGGIEIN